MHNRTLRTNHLIIAALVSGLVSIAAPASGQVINEELKLLPTDGDAGDWFGWSIAIDNGIVAVGAFIDEDNGSFSGSAYLFDASTGVQLFKLLPSDGAQFGAFGYSVAIDNGVVAIGAYGDDDNGYASGAAYLFDASSGAQLAKLVADDAAAIAGLGWSIAIDNGVVAVGATGDVGNGSHSGSAYLFLVSTGEQLFKLLPTDGAGVNQFGWSIAIDNGIVAVGTLEDDDSAPGSGSAYIFDATTGFQIAKLLASDGATGDRFGHSIAIDNGVVAVGAYQAAAKEHRSGSAYLFDATTGVQIAKLLPDDGAPVDEFGVSIAIDSGVVAVGAWNHYDNGLGSGSAYLFDAATGAQIAKFLPSDPETFQALGSSISIDNGVVAVGSFSDNDNGSASGSAYVFDANDLCFGDVNGDGTVDPLDIGFVLARFGCSVGTGDPDCNAADANGDGAVDPLDSGFVLARFGECP